MMEGGSDGSGGSEEERNLMGLLKESFDGNSETIARRAANLKFSIVPRVAQ
jgi:hypothetical protein